MGVLSSLLYKMYKVTRRTSRSIQEAPRVRVRDGDNRDVATDYWEALSVDAAVDVAPLYVHAHVVYVNLIGASTEKTSPGG